MTVLKDAFGSTHDGRHVDRFTLDNGFIRLQALTYGGVITSLSVPDRSGRHDDVVLGFDTVGEYERESPYFGAIIGRYANRLAHARFVLDGKTHQLDANEGPHHAHGGARGFDKRLWEAQPIETAGCVGVVFSRVSADGEEHYPGEVAVQVSYTLTRSNEVTFDYHATTTAPTVINLTQHTYFDLSAGAAPDICDHVLTLRATHFTPVEDAELIPTGEIRAVDDTPFDFRSARPIGSRIDASDPQLTYGLGYDHNWILEGGTATSAVAAVLHDPRSGRTLEVRTTEPGVQFYSGNRLNIAAGKNHRPYGRRRGVCLETQHFPDSPAHPHFPSTVLRPDETFRSRTTWTFGSDG